MAAVSPWFFTHYGKTGEWAWNKYVPPVPSLVLYLADQEFPFFYPVLHFFSRWDVKKLDLPVRRPPLCDPLDEHLGSRVRPAVCSDYQLERLWRIAL
jgi:hypothetical protein